MNIGVTSKSQLKIDAIVDACEEMAIKHHTLISIDCDSRINDQPFNMDETLLGAENRLNDFKTKMLNRNETCDMIISIENGIIKMGERYIDMAVIVIETHGHVRFYSTSSGIEFDSKYVDEARKRGFYSNTVGSVMAELIGCTGNDPHSTLTHGHFSRQEILTDGVMKCLSQID